MGTGSQGSSSNASASYDIWNRKTKLIDSGANIAAAGKIGAGQDAYCDSTGSGFNRGSNYELNTTNEVWIPKQSSTLYPNKCGLLYPCSSTFATNLDGFLTVATSTGTVALASLDTTNGLANTFASAASVGAQAGYNMGLLFTVRNFNPCMRITFKISSTATNTRLFIGFINQTGLVGNTNDPLNAVAGIGIGKITTSTNWQILKNGGSGATVPVDTGVALDTNVHRFGLFADTANSRWWWVLDDTTSGFTTTDDPGATTSLSAQRIITTNETVAKTLSVYADYIGSDK